MFTDRRRFWTFVLFVGLFAPFVVVFLLSLLTPAPMVRQVDGVGPAAATIGPQAGPRIMPPGGAGGGAGSHLANAFLFAASDGRDVWVVQPIRYEPGSGKTPVDAHQVLRRAGNTAAWMQVTLGGSPVWSEFPKGLAVTRGAGREAGYPYVFHADGSLNSYSPAGRGTEDSLPTGQLLHAAVGARQGVFALTLGPAAAATRPGEPLRIAPVLSEVESAPATASAPATTRAAATKPAAEGPRVFNVSWYKDHQWTYLPALGEASSDGAAVPTPSSHVALAVHGEYVIALWVDPLRPGNLVVRALDLSQAAPVWSGPIASKLPEQTPTVSRLLTAEMDGKLYIFWVVPTGDAVELRGGQLETRGMPAEGATRFALNPRGVMPAVSLGPTSRGISPESDVAVATSENAFVAVMETREGTLASVSFGQAGEVLSGPAAIELVARKPEFRVGQNITMLLMAVIFVLSLWQWRQKTPGLALPAGMVLAPLNLRAVAFLIDVVIPYVAVLAVFGPLDAPLSLMKGWVQGYATPELLFTTPEFPIFLGSYFVMVTLGELVFRRSIGKACVGLQVLMMDGRAPTVGAILLRNIIRVPELVTMFLPLYVMISEHRQRLGDLLARTLVVGAKPPDVPEDPDARPKSRKP